MIREKPSASSAAPPTRAPSTSGWAMMSTMLPAFTEPYRKGWQLAVEEVNAAGGINGKKLVVISKDDGG